MESLGRKRKQNDPQRKPKEKRVCNYDAVTDFARGFESPEVTLIEDHGTSKKCSNYQAKLTGTVYDRHKQPGEFNHRNCNLPSYKIHKKPKIPVEQQKIDLTSDSDEDPVASSRVAPAVVGFGDKQVDFGDNHDNQPEPHYSTAPDLPTLDKTIDIFKKAQDILSLNPKGSTSQFPYFTSISQSTGYPSVKYPHPNMTSVHPQKSSLGSSKTRLFRNSMESSLPALTHQNKCSTKTNDTQSNYRPGSGNHRFQVTDKQTPKKIDSEALTSNEHLEQSQSCWSDECLGLESANVSFVKQSDISDEPSTPPKRTSRSPSVQYSDSSEASPMHHFISKSKEESIANRDEQVKKSVRSRKHSEAISVDSQSPIGSPANKDVLNEDEVSQDHIVVGNESGDESMIKKLQKVAKDRLERQTEDDSLTSKYFLPPITPVCSVAHTNVRNRGPTSNPGPSEGAIHSQNSSTCRTILDSINNPSDPLSPEHSSSSDTSPERTTVPSHNFLLRKSETATVPSSSPSHSNPFSKTKSPVYDPIFGSPLFNKDQLRAGCAAHTKKLSLTLNRQAASFQPGSPSLSKEGFTIELSGKTSSGNSLRDSGFHKRTVGEIHSSNLTRQPLRSTKQHTNGPQRKGSDSENFYNNKATAESRYSLFAHNSSKFMDRARLRSKRSTTTGQVLTSFGAKNLKLVGRPRTRRFATNIDDDEDSVQLDVTHVQIGRLIPDKVFNVDLHRDQLTITLDYEGMNATVKVNTDSLTAWQMHLGCDPYVIVVLVKQTEAKKIAKQLSHKLHLDTDFFQPKSEDASERYIILQLDDTPPPEHIVTINEMLGRASSRSQGTIAVDTELSTNEANEILEEAKPLKPPRSHGGTLQKSAFDKLCKGFNRKPIDKPPAVTEEFTRVRRSQRTRKPVIRTDPSDPISVEDPIVKKRPNKKLLTYNVPAGSKVAIEVSTNDVATLDPGEYLNDIVMDVYLRYIWYERLAEEFRSKIHIFSSFFHTRLKDASRDNKELNTPQRVHDRVRTWTRRVDLFNKEYIILPVCDRAHWFVVFVYKAGEFDASTVIPRKTSKTKMKNTKKGSKRLKKTKKNSKVSESVSIVEELVAAVEGSESENSLQSVGSPITEDNETVPGSLLQSASNVKVDSTGSDTEIELLRECVVETPPACPVEEVNLCSEDDTHVQEGCEDNMNDEVEGDESVNSDPLPEDQQSPSRELITDDSSGFSGISPEGSNLKVEEEISPCILVLDSLGIRRTGIVRTIRNYLTVEWKEKKGASNDEELSYEFLPAKYPKIPLQNNSSDCGLFVLQYVESLLLRMEQGKPYPQMSEEWASYDQTKTKRKEIMNIIMDLSKRQTGDTADTPTES